MMVLQCIMYNSQIVRPLEEALHQTDLHAL